MTDQRDLEQQLTNMENKLHSSVKMAEMEKQFIKEANATYEKNLVALAKYLPELYDKFSVFQPKDEFKLFLNDNGTANIIDYGTKFPMYNETPLEQVQEQVKNSLDNPHISRINYSHLEHLKNQYDYTHVKLLNKIGKAYNLAKNELENNTKLSGKQVSVVVFGVGLGYHLEELLEKVPSAYLNIFEPEEDYFFASLFTFDWARFLNKVDKAGTNFYISIGVSEDETYKELYARAQDLGPFTISNSFFFQHYPSVSINKLILKLRDNFHQIFMGWGFIDDAFMSLAHTCKNVEKRLPVFPGRVNGENKFKDFPVFIVANGPSLDNDIETIKKYRDKVLLIACNSVTTALLKHDIIPDFHAALERCRLTYDFLKVYIPEEYRKQISLLTVNVMHEEVADLFAWSGAGLKGREAGTSLFQIAEVFSGVPSSGTLPFCNPLVGNMALSYALSFGFKNIYMFGVDNGYVDPEHHHSKSSMYYNGSGKTVYQPLQIGDRLRVEGNFGGVVITDHFLNAGKVQMERLLLTDVARGASCFNCSNGSKIEGTTSLPSSDIIIQSSAVNKETVADYIRNELFYVPEADFSLENRLDFEGFEKLCSTMVEILNKPSDTRDQALDNVLEQINFLISLKNTQFSHHYMILEGEALYANAVIINLLFNFGDEISIMPYYETVKQVWCDFLSSAPDMYRERWNESSDHEFEFLD